MSRLLTYSEIQQALDREFAPLEPMLDGFRLTPSRLSSTQVRDFEQRFQESLPASFADAILKYDLGKLTIGPVAFCNTGDYLHVAETRNSPGSEAWWGSGDRPRGQLLIANSDPYAIILDTHEGAVGAFLHEEFWASRRRVARDFENFVRGVGTVFVERQTSTNKRQLADEILAECGGDPESPFWEWLAA